MSIGIFDEDAYRNPLSFPNFDVMQATQYFAKKREIVKFCYDYKPELYSKFYIFKEYADGKFMPTHGYNNIIYCGRAINDGKNNPVILERDIGGCDVSYYRRNMERIPVDNSIAQLAARHIATSQHTKLSLNGTDWWNNWDRYITLYKAKKQSIFLHDYNLGAIPHAAATLSERFRGTKVRIGWKYPLVLDSLGELLDWGAVPRDKYYSQILFTHYLEDNQFAAYIRQAIVDDNEGKFTYYITKSQYTENEIIKNYLPKFYLQGLFSRMAAKSFSLIYEDNFFSDTRWEQFISMLNYYTRGCSTPVPFMDEFVGIFSFLDGGGKELNKTINVGGILDFVRQQSPILYHLITTCKQAKLQGGKIYGR